MARAAVYVDGSGMSGAPRNRVDTRGEYATPAALREDSLLPWSGLSLVCADGAEGAIIRNADC